MLYKFPVYRETGETSDVSVPGEAETSEKTEAARKRHEEDKAMKTALIFHICGSIIKT